MRSPQRVRDRDLDPTVDDADRVVAQPPDPGEPPRLGLLAGRVDLGVATAGRPGRVIGAVGIETAGRRHLDGVAGAQVELPLVERAGDDAAVEFADRQRRAHVRAAVVGGDDPGRRVGEQDVELAARDPTHRALGEVGDVEDRFERGVLDAECRELGGECRRSRIHQASNPTCQR